MYKIRLLCGDSKVEPRGLSTRAAVVEGVSIRFSNIVIADSQNLKILCGDIINAFIQANTKEKIYTVVELNLEKEKTQLQYLCVLFIALQHL